MKKIRLVAIFFVSIFSFNLLVKADASYQYCQYDKKGDYYVIGDCNHYFSEEQDRNTLAPLSRCIKGVLSEKVFFIKKGYNEQKFPKACVDVILEPLRKLYGEGINN